MRIITFDVIITDPYAARVIRGFRDEDTERVFRRERVRKVSEAVQRVAYRKLIMLDAATSLMDLRVPPGNRLEKLIGHRTGQYSIRVNERWRICFVWREGDAHEVEVVDYH